MVRRGDQSDVKHVALCFDFDPKKVYAVDWLISMVIKQIRLWNKRGTQVVDKLFSVFIWLIDRRRWYSKMSFIVDPLGK